MKNHCTKSNHCVRRSEHDDENASMGSHQRTTAKRLYADINFASGEKKLFDARPLLAKAIYKPLNNLSFFLTAKADCGSVAWSDEIDIAPEYLYECSLPLQVI